MDAEIDLWFSHTYCSWWRAKGQSSFVLPSITLSPNRIPQQSIKWIIHVGQQQGIDRACKSTPIQSLRAIRLLSSLSCRLHLNMIVCIYILWIKRDAWDRKFVCNYTAAKPCHIQTHMHITVFYLALYWVTEERTYKCMQVHFCLWKNCFSCSTRPKTTGREFTITFNTPGHYYEARRHLKLVR